EQVVGNYAVYDVNGEQVTGELSVSETYTIQRIRKEVAQENVTLGEYDNVYDGEEKKPTVTVVVDGKTLVEGKDYDVEYANNVYVSTEENGKATATVTFKGAYKGQAVVEFEIIQDPSTGEFDGEGVTF
ncbi:MAG: hypothetical protein IJB97_08170, partial [Clostridia bacterium]|nr:hypothetical protein [Clostridia bacterium]